MLLDQAGELIADVMTANRSLASIPSASAILDTSNYTFHAISYGKDADGFRYHAHQILNTTVSTIPSQKSLILLGGLNNQGNYASSNDWQLSGSTWVSVSTVNPISSVITLDHCTAYDSNRGVLVLFKRLNNTSETWEFSGNRSSVGWRLVSTFTPANSVGLPPSAPWPRQGAAMVYDSSSNKVLLFGGSDYNFDPNYSIYYNDLWSWDGTTWTQLVTTNNPYPRANHKLSFDKSRNRVVLFGGNNNQIYNSIWSYAISGTWELNLNTSSWSLVSTSGPPPRFFHGMVYDESISKTLVIGGINYGRIQSGVWAWDGSNWSLLASEPINGVTYHAATYNPQTSSTLIFGGNTTNPNYYADVREFKYTRSPQWITLTPQSNNGPAGLIGATLDYFDYKDSYVGAMPGTDVIRTLSYESPSVSSYHTSATALALADIYKLLPNEIKPLDTRLESKSTITNYSTNVPDIGHCLNSYLDPNLSSHSNLVGCFPAASGTPYWIISSTFNPSLNVIISGTLSSVYNQQKIMDSFGFLTFAPGTLSAHNELNLGKNYLSGVVRTTPAEFPQKVRLAWGLYPGDAGSLLLFGGIYHIGLWYLDLKQMLKQGYYPPYNFNALNNIRKYKLFAKKTFNKDLLYLNDNGSSSGFKSVFEQNGLSSDCIRYIWDIKFY